MAVVPTILPALDAIRAIGGMLGLRPFKVIARKRSWTGGRPGVQGSIKQDTDVVLTDQGADGQLYPVLVRQVSRREALASGGQYTSRDLRVGPITPAFAASFLPAAGFDDTAIDPALSGVTTEVIWIVSSSSGTHGIPASGIVCEKRGEEATSLHYYVILRATGRAPS
jgi:hypothetical protein